MTTEELIGLVLDDYRVNGKRSLRSVICHSKPLLRFFERIPESAIEVERYKAQRRANGRSPSTIRNELSLLHSAFVLAKDLGLITDFPKIRFPRVCNVRTTTCTPQQAKKILSALEVLDRDVYDLVSWLLFTGWRQGESRKLLWCDVAADRLSVQLPQERSKNLLVRCVRLGKASHGVLERRWLKKAGKWVFHRCGRPIITFRGAWQRAVDGAEVPDLRPHDLRRVFAQLSADAGVSPAVAMQIAGWKSFSTFLRYSISNGQMQAQAQDRVAAYFHG